jgi:hypothetical protein
LSQPKRSISGKKAVETMDLTGIVWRVLPAQPEHR